MADRRTELLDVVTTAIDEDTDSITAVVDALLAAGVVTGGEALAEWLYAINWPFDLQFTPPPPVDVDRIARIWNERDDWRISHEDAVACIQEEGGLPVADGGDAS